MTAKDKRFLVPAHLGDAQIVAYLDGELRRTEMDAARSHLESCWSCRSRMGEAQETVDRFLEARKLLLPDETVLAESRVEQFSQRLARHASSLDAVRVPFGERLVAQWTGLRHSAFALFQYRKAALAALVTACLLVVMFTDVLNTRVSADTVLLRAENYERSQLTQSGHVLRTSVQVDRIDRHTNQERPLGTITIVRDSASPAVYATAQSTSGDVESATSTNPNQVAEPLLRVVFADAHADSGLLQYLTQEQWIPDVSIPEFRRLIGVRGMTEASARRGDGTFELHYPFAAAQASGIAEMVLRVNARDYAPTGLSIFTTPGSSDSEYRFTRTALSSELRTPEIANLFVAVSSTSPARPNHQSLQMSRPVPLSYANSHATESEVSLAAVLHNVDACLGEEINLFPMSDGSLLVQGLVDNAARRETLRQALKSVPGDIRIEVYIPRELRSGSELYSSPDQPLQELSHASDTRSVTFSDLNAANTPIQEILFQHFSKLGASAEDTQKQVASFSNEVVTLARQTFLHAWALKRLEREFSAERTSGLSATALAEIEKMRGDHRRWISTTAHREAEMIAPIAGPEAPSGVPDSAQGQDSEALLRLAQEENDLVVSLFAPSQPTSQPATSVSRLMAVLKHLSA